MCRPCQRCAAPVGNVPPLREMCRPCQRCAAPVRDVPPLSEIKSRNSEREAGRKTTYEVEEDSDDPGAIPPRRRTFQDLHSALEEARECFRQQDCGDSFLDVLNRLEKNTKQQECAVKGKQRKITDFFVQ